MTIHLGSLCGGHWGEHPSFPPSDWAHEALNDETRLGYWDWVEAQLAGSEDAEQLIEESS